MLGEEQRTHRIGVVAALTMATFWAGVSARADDPDRLRPYEANPRYWQCKGRPVLLLGGTDDDNLFQWPAERLAAQLDLLVSVGGSCVRNTMSCRDEGNVFPFARTTDGRFDLDRWDDSYWRRLHRLLTLAHERDVIVQIELWDPHDYYRDGGELGGWSRQPFRPANQVNYTLAESGLIDVVDWSAVHDPEKDHPFFQSAPAERDLALVRQYQERFVAKVLEVAISFPNVLCCVSNESNDGLVWSDYWAAYLRREANARGRRIEIGEMRFPRTPHHDDIRHLIARADLYDFIDISQMNRPARQEHWDHLMYLHKALTDRPRPLNNTKIYGSDEVAWTGGYRTGEECFWRDGLVDANDLELLTRYLGTVIPEMGLIAHWKLDETEGVVAHDSEGKNDATIMGIPLWHPEGGMVDGALEFSGVPNFATTKVVRNPSEGALSVFAWVKGGGPGQVVISQQSGANWLMASVPDGTVGTELKSGGRQGSGLASGSGITDGNWHRIGFSWDSETRILYVDDIEVARDTQESLACSTGNMTIGAGSSLTPATFWKGLIDDVRIYRRAVRP